MKYKTILILSLIFFSCKKEFIEIDEVSQTEIKNVNYKELPLDFSVTSSSPLLFEQNNKLKLITYNANTLDYDVYILNEISETWELDFSLENNISSYIHSVVAFENEIIIASQSKCSIYRRSDAFSNFVFKKSFYPSDYFHHLCKSNDKYYLFENSGTARYSLPTSDSYSQSDFGGISNEVILINGNYFITTNEGVFTSSNQSTWNKVISNSYSGTPFIGLFKYKDGFVAVRVNNSNSNNITNDYLYYNLNFELIETIKGENTSEAYNGEYRFSKFIYQDDFLFNFTYQLYNSYSTRILLSSTASVEFKKEEIKKIDNNQILGDAPLSSILFNGKIYLANYVKTNVQINGVSKSRYVIREISTQ